MKARTPKSKIPAPPGLRRIAKPSELDARDRKQFMGMIGIGVPPADACHAIGLSPSRYKEWMDERNEDPDVTAFREEVLRADGQGVAQQVKLLWDGGRLTPVKDDSGRVIGSRVEISKTLCEQHRFLLARRRPSAFSLGQSGDGAQGGQGRGETIEQEVAEQIIAVLKSAGVTMPTHVLETVGVTTQ